MTGLERILPDTAATEGFGERLARLLRAGDAVILTGELGAGKTALTRGIGAGLGVEGTVSSPTFVIARTHRTRSGVPLVHVDAYRLPGADELADLDLDLVGAITVIEWGRGRAEPLLESWLDIELERRVGTSGIDADDEPRVLRATPHGGDWPSRLARLG